MRKVLTLTGPGGNTLYVERLSMKKGTVYASGWYDNGQPFKLADLFPVLKEAA